ncbi:M15 family metallopeptidase [Kribbella albertanoniae]|uniref:M15 family metallopeptidase n=1 Tax=Kribbella albertanoniae TaxID=1266829 RepID=UPI001EE11128|nr:M15 family metallopeptidase [Kribbella albertanoniae]
MRTLAVLRLDERRADAEGAYAYLRRSVADRLIVAQTLLPRGLRLLIVEGYRPQDCRRICFDEYCDAVAPHVAGAAIDLTLATISGQELPLGSFGVDPVDVSEEVSRNRNILSAALGAVNLVSGPTEWWHWSFGDRHWAFTSNAAAAFYGPIPTLADGLKLH